MASFCRSAIMASTRSLASRSKSLTQNTLNAKSMSSRFNSTPTRTILASSRVLSVLGSVESLMPLHTAIANARLKSSIAVDSSCWSWLSQGRMDEVNDHAQMGDINDMVDGVDETSRVDGSDNDSAGYDDDYTPSDEGEYEFADAIEDEWILSMAIEIEKEIKAESESDKEWIPRGEDTFDDRDDGDTEDFEYESEDDGNKRVKKRKIVDPTTNITAVKFEYGPEGIIEFRESQVFNSVYHFRDILEEYQLKAGYALRKKKNGKDKVSAHCLGSRCNWKIYASLLPDGRTFMIKTLKPKHTCIRHMFDNQVFNDHVTNNVAESFNNWVGKFRNLPIVTLLEKIRLKIMSRFNNRLNKALELETRTTPHTRKLLDTTIEKARLLKIFRANNDEFQVYEGPTRISVNFQSSHCSCLAWSISGLPCKHIVPCLEFKRGELEDYCNWFYTTEAFRKTYNEVVHPLPDADLDPNEAKGEKIVLPPKLKRGIGRPRKNRRREPGEEPAGGTVRKKSSTVRCNICKQFGHNSRTCQRDSVEQLQGINTVKSRNKGGRPRKDGRPIGSGPIACMLAVETVSATINTNNGNSGSGVRGGRSTRGGRSVRGSRGGRRSRGGRAGMLVVAKHSFDDANTIQGQSSGTILDLVTTTSIGSHLC